MKTCFKCLQSLPPEAFYKHSRMGDGRLGKCKECTKNDVKSHRLANIERIRSYDKLRSSMPHRIAGQAGRTKDYRARFPKRSAANAAVAREVRAGRMIPLPCMVCGEKAVAHHPDYDRPLDVVWLCQPHHKQAHALVELEPA